MDEDLTYADENTVVGLEGGRLVSCVQIFPRPVRVRGRDVPMGGIGGVFTHPEHRRRGHAVRLLEFAAEHMIGRGIELSLLFGVRTMYPALGWKPWGATAHLLSRAAGGAEPRVLPDGVEASPFEPGRDLADVRALHAAYSGGLDGPVVRDDRLWETSLRIGGNPREEFAVARKGGELVAYARAVVVSSFLSVSEVGRLSDAADALAALIERVLLPRDDDPLAPPERPSTELRRLVALPALVDEQLLAALLARGIIWRTVADPSTKWRCLDPAGLARRLGVSLDPGEDAESFLRRVFPPGRSTFWPTDRF